MLAQGFLDLFFGAAPHHGYFFQFFELSTKEAFTKAAFDTLRVDGGHVLDFRTRIAIPLAWQ